MEGERAGGRRERGRQRESGDDDTLLRDKFTRSAFTTQKSRVLAVTVKYATMGDRSSTACLMPILASFLGERERTR